MVQNMMEYVEESLQPSKMRNIADSGEGEGRDGEGQGCSGYMKEN